MDLDMPILQPLGECDLWQLVGDWSVPFSLPDGRAGRVFIGAGFVTDGASVPRMAWAFAGHPMESPRVVAALAHDWLYASHAVDRATADAVYAAILRAVGRASWRVAIEHAVLRMFGGFAYDASDGEMVAHALEHGRLEWTSTASPEWAKGRINTET